MGNPEIVTEESENSEADNNLMTETDVDLDGEVNVPSTLGDGILKDHVVNSQNPGQAVVNLFDYCQYAGEFDGTKEEAHDYWTDDTKKENAVTTYNLGISQGHLLRFGY